MNNKVAYAICVLTGTTIGASATWIFAKKKYEKIIDEEVESARETYTRLSKELADKNSVSKLSINPAIKQDDTLTTQEFADSYLDMVNEYIVTDEEVDADNETEEGITLIKVSSEANAPRIIAVEDYGSEEDYALESLTYYYGDKVLADENDEIIEDPNTAVGLDNLDTFEKSYENRLYVRNDTRQIDYEILLDERGYAEVHS